MRRSAPQWGGTASSPPESPPRSEGAIVRQMSPRRGQDLPAYPDRPRANFQADAPPKNPFADRYPECCSRRGAQIHRVSRQMMNHDDEKVTPPASKPPVATRHGLGTTLSTASACGSTRPLRSSCGMRGRQRVAYQHRHQQLEATVRVLREQVAVPAQTLKDIGNSQLPDPRQPALVTAGPAPKAGYRQGSPSFLEGLGRSQTRHALRLQRGAVSGRPRHVYQAATRHFVAASYAASTLRQDVNGALAAGPRPNWLIVRTAHVVARQLTQLRLRKWIALEAADNSPYSALRDQQSARSWWLDPLRTDHHRQHHRDATTRLPQLAALALCTEGGSLRHTFARARAVRRQIALGMPIHLQIHQNTRRCRARQRRIEVRVRALLDRNAALGGSSAPLR